MAKVKPESSKPEKIKVNVMKKETRPSRGSGGFAENEKAGHSLWSSPDMDGGFAEEMQHDPGEVVHPVDLSVPEPAKNGSDKPVNSAGEPAPEPDLTLAEPETTGPDAAQSVEAGPDEGPEDVSTPGADAVYKDDEEFYSSKLKPATASGKNTSSTKAPSRTGKYSNPRFVFILTLFITTLVCGLIMLAILEQRHPGSSLIFEYLPQL